MANPGQMKYILVRINSTNNSLAELFPKSELIQSPIGNKVYSLLVWYDKRCHIKHPSAALPTADSDSSSPAGRCKWKEAGRLLKLVENLSRQQQGDAVIPLSQQHKDIREDLVQVGTTPRNQRTSPSRSNTKNSLNTMSFSFIFI